MRCLRAVVFFVLVVAASYARADYPYYVTDLGAFSPLAVNGQGVVVGTLPSPFSSPLALYSNGLIKPIPQPSDGSFFFNTVAVANFTDSGTIAFSANVSINSTNATLVGAPVIYQNGSFTVVPNVMGLGALPNSWGLNSEGIVAGNVSGVGNFVFDGTNTATTSTNDRYFAFNDLGQQIGAVRQQGLLTAVINNNGTITTLLDSRGNPYQFAGPSVINDNEYAIIAGALGIINGSHFTPLPLTGLPGGGYVSLSSSNTAVGKYQSTIGTRAIYFDGTSAADLNSLIDPTSEWTLTSATWISDTGYIIGQGTHYGVSANFLLTPVPEPVVGGFILIGVTLLLSRQRKQIVSRGGQQ